MGLGDGWPGRPTDAQKNKAESEREVRRLVRPCNPLYSAACGFPLGVADKRNDKKHEDTVIENTNQPC